MRGLIHLDGTRGRVFSCLILCILVLLAYLPTLSGEFILDDRPLIRDNPYVRSLQSVLSYLSQEDGVEETALSETSHTGYYRPLVNFTYWLDYRLWGLRAQGFRATNLALHLLNCLILLGFITMLTGERPMALLITALFAVHPVHSEAVAWISSRNNILASIFGLLSLHFHIQGWRKRKFGLNLLSALFFAFSLLSKEFGLMLVPILFLFHRVYPEKERPAREEMAAYLPYLLILSFYLGLRMLVIGSLTPPTGGADPWGRIYFSPYVFMMNLRYFLFPSGLHSFILGYPDSYGDWRALAGFVCLGLYAFFLWKIRRRRVPFWGSASFLVGLFPILNIVKTSAVTLISMRWLYFPSIFLVLCIFLAKEFLFRKRHLVFPIAGAVVLYFGCYTFILNQGLWKNEDRFFQQEVHTFQNWFYLGGLAENLLSRGKLVEAEIHFKNALEKRPAEARNYINYSALLLETNRPSDALACLTRAADLHMTRHEKAELHNNLGMAFFRLQRREDALKSLGMAIHFAPKTAEFWSNLGSAYGSIGDYERSISILEEGLAVVSDPTPLKRNLAVSYMEMREFEKAIAVLESIPIQEGEDRKVISDLLSQAREGAAERDGRKNEKVRKGGSLPEGSSRTGQ